MKLTDILSKAPLLEFSPIDGFLGNQRLKPGKRKTIEGKVRLSFDCENCGGTVVFTSTDKIACIGVSDDMVSVDCVLACDSHTESIVPIWFLVQSEEKNIHAMTTKVRIIKRSEKLFEGIETTTEGRYGTFDKLLNKSESAYRDDLGAGAMAYLRIILEHATKESAVAVGIVIKKGTTFEQLLEAVDKQCKIIPDIFSDKGYTLYRELSHAMHGGCDDITSLQKYAPCRRLVEGILDNIKNRKELSAARDALWGGGVA